MSHDDATAVYEAKCNLIKIIYHKIQIISITSMYLPEGHSLY